jgi:hypothetical protein
MYCIEHSAPKAENSHVLLSRPERTIIRPKKFIERRRRQTTPAAGVPMLGDSPTVAYGRRESDALHARLQKWVELGDKIIQSDDSSVDKPEEEG